MTGMLCMEERVGITGGFGTTMDLERGTSRKWVVARDGITRWADNGEPVDRRKGLEMDNKEFELRNDLAIMKERTKMYTETIAAQELEIASLKETLTVISDYAVERGAVADLPNEPLWVIREMAHDAL